MHKINLPQRLWTFRSAFYHVTHCDPQALMADNVIVSLCVTTVTFLKIEHKNYIIHICHTIERGLWLVHKSLKHRRFSGMIRSKNCFEKIGKVQGVTQESCKKVHSRTLLDVKRTSTSILVLWQKNYCNTALHYCNMTLLGGRMVKAPAEWHICSCWAVSKPIIG